MHFSDDYDPNKTNNYNNKANSLVSELVQTRFVMFIRF